MKEPKKKPSGHERVQRGAISALLCLDVWAFLWCSEGKYQSVIYWSFFPPSYELYHTGKKRRKKFLAVFYANRTRSVFFNPDCHVKLLSLERKAH
jgi:hypothetical protein